MTVNKAVVELWVTTLEGDAYTQGREMLHSEDGSMCCLGVLCDLYQKQTGLGEWKPRITADNGGFMFLASDGDDVRGDSYGLPGPVMAWVGVEESVPVIGGAQLATLNDGPDGKPHLAWSFTEIAAHLRKHLLEEVSCGIPID